MSWSKVSEHRWERPADSWEGYFIFTGNLTASLCEGRQHYTIVSKLKINIAVVDVVSALKQAWVQLRYEQPQLATTAEGTKFVYEVPDDVKLQHWVTSTFIVSSASNADELYQSAQPVKQATLYYVPNSSELMFRAPHYRIDGVGTLLFWHSYLSALANPTKDIHFGDEPSRLAPMMDEVLGSKPPTQEQTEKAAAILMAWASSCPGIGPVSDLGTAPPGQCQNLEVVFPIKTTEALIKASKSKGISVTSAIHAAYVMALVRHANPNSNQSEYVAISQFNLRHYLPEPYSTSKYAVSLYYTPFPFKLNLPSTFWDATHALDKYYKTTFKNNTENLQLREPLTRAIYDLAQSPEFLASPVPSDALVSSLGVVEQYLHQSYSGTVPVKVEDLKFGVDIVMGMDMFFIYTFRDQLRMVYSFNDGFEKPANVQTYLEEMRKVLDEELLS